MMPFVTGMGCAATALIGAFAATNPSPLQAAVHAMALMGIAGEMAAEKSAGPGTLQVQFLDALYRVQETDIADRLKIKKV
jgi:hydroxyethylthiazole kinase